MKPKILKQTVIFSATPNQVYEALMDFKQHAAFTGDTAKISRSIGGRISAWGGYISGKNLSLVENKKIVQAWRAEDWPKNTWSEVSFTLTKTARGTRLAFVQTGLPEEQYEETKKGWVEFYWEPMKKYFKKQEASSR